MGVYVCCVCAHICMCSRMTQYKGVQSIEEATTCRNKSRAKRNGLGPKSPFSTPTPSVSLWVMTVSPIIIGRSQRHGGKTLPGGKGAGVCPSQPPRQKAAAVWKTNDHGAHNHFHRDFSKYFFLMCLDEGRGSVDDTIY